MPDSEESLEAYGHALAGNHEFFGLLFAKVRMALNADDSRLGTDCLRVGSTHAGVILDAEGDGEALQPVPMVATDIGQADGTVTRLIFSCDQATALADMLAGAANEAADQARRWSISNLRNSDDDE